jgi:hypothetical protein
LFVSNPGVAPLSHVCSRSWCLLGGGWGKSFCSLPSPFLSPPLPLLTSRLLHARSGLVFFAPFLALSLFFLGA